MISENKNARRAMVTGAFAFAFGLFGGTLGGVFAILAIGFGIKAILDYKKDNKLGGKGVAITSIVVGILVILRVTFFLLLS